MYYTNSPMHYDSFLIVVFSAIIGYTVQFCLYPVTGLFTIMTWVDFIEISKMLPAIFSGLAFYLTNEKKIVGKIKQIKAWFKRGK